MHLYVFNTSGGLFSVREEHFWSRPAQVWFQINFIHTLQHHGGSRGVKSGTGLFSLLTSLSVILCVIIFIHTLDSFFHEKAAKCQIEEATWMALRPPVGVSLVLKELSKVQDLFFVLFCFWIFQMKAALLILKSWVLWYISYSEYWYIFIF